VRHSELQEFNHSEIFMADLINMRSSGSRTCMPQRHAAAAPAVPVRPRRAAVQAKCILTPNQPDVGGRRELERRSALALSCTERSPVSAAEHLLGGGAYSQASFSSPRRIRVAVDVDEGTEMQLLAGGPPLLTSMVGVLQTPAGVLEHAADLDSCFLQCWDASCTR
jgi:hypothetical protein